MDVPFVVSVAETQMHHTCGQIVPSLHGIIVRPSRVFQMQYNAQLNLLSCWLIISVRSLDGWLVGRSIEWLAGVSDDRSVIWASPLQSRRNHL